MNHPKHLLVLSFVLLALAACNGSKTATKANNTTTVQDPKALGEQSPLNQVPFNACKVECKVVSVSALGSGSTVVLTVQKVMACGRDFDGADIAGRQIEAIAAQPLPKLKSGSAIACMLTSAPVMGGNKPRYNITDVSAL